MYSRVKSITNSPEESAIVIYQDNQQIVPYRKPCHEPIPLKAQTDKSFSAIRIYMYDQSGEREARHIRIQKITDWLWECGVEAINRDPYLLEDFYELPVVNSKNGSSQSMKNQVHAHHILAAGLMDYARIDPAGVVQLFTRWFGMTLKEMIEGDAAITRGIGHITFPGPASIGEFVLAEDELLNVLPVVIDAHWQMFEPFILREHFERIALRHTGYISPESLIRRYIPLEYHSQYLDMVRHSVPVLSIQDSSASGILQLIGGFLNSRDLPQVARLQILPTCEAASQNLALVVSSQYSQIKKYFPGNQDSMKIEYMEANAEVNLDTAEQGGNIEVRIGQKDAILYCMEDLGLKPFVVVYDSARILGGRRKTQNLAQPLLLTDGEQGLPTSAKCELINRFGGCYLMEDVTAEAGGRRVVCDLLAIAFPAKLDELRPQHLFPSLEHKRLHILALMLMLFNAARGRGSPIVIDRRGRDDDDSLVVALQLVAGLPANQKVKVIVEDSIANIYRKVPAKEYGEIATCIARLSWETGNIYDNNALSKFLITHYASGKIICSKGGLEFFRSIDYLVNHLVSDLESIDKMCGKKDYSFFHPPEAQGYDRRNKNMMNNFIHVLADLKKYAAKMLVKHPKITLKIICVKWADKALSTFSNLPHNPGDCKTVLDLLRSPEGQSTRLEQSICQKVGLNTLEKTGSRHKSKREPARKQIM